MTCEHCQSKHNAMLMARDNAEAFKAERDRVRQEALTRIDALAADNERLRAELESEKTLYAVTRAGAEVFRDAYTELREAAERLCHAMDDSDDDSLVGQLRAVLAKLTP